MKEFFGAFTSYIKRGVISPMFFICTGLCTLMMIFVVHTTYSSEYYNPPGLYYFLNRVDHSGSIYFTMMIAVFPAALLFYEDWTSGYFKFIFPKVGRKKYAFAVSFASGMVAALVLTLSYVIFTAFILTRFPAVPDLKMEALRDNSYGFPNSGLLYTGHAFWCYILYFLTQGARAAFFAVVAVFQSMIITNKHLTALSPVLVYILYFAFNFYNILPTLANPFVLFWNGFKLYLIFGGTTDGNLFSPIAAIYPMIFCVLIVTVLSLIESKILRTKMNKSI